MSQVCVEMKLPDVSREAKTEIKMESRQRSSLQQEAGLESRTHLSVDPVLFAGEMTAYMPPRWTGDTPGQYSYLFLNQELDLAEFRGLYPRLIQEGWVNPRVFSPIALEMASLYHPLFFYAVVHRASAAMPAPLHRYLNNVHALHLTQEVSNSASSPVHFWLQSVVFLAGVTLSAAIIQNRWSSGTLLSKFARLWQAGCVGRHGLVSSIDGIGLCEHVERLVKTPMHPLECFLELKEIFAQAVTCLARGVSATMTTLTPASLTREQQARFGFVSDLRQQIGSNLLVVLVYGSSVNSQAFADYDLILVVRDAGKVLRQLAGSHPSYQGRELNIGVYQEQDFWNYQLLSGDNLTDHALCLHGEVVVPIKSRHDLVARNFSFGFVRMRQLLGMAAFAANHVLQEPGDDKRNLYEYFVKIPLNVIRGLQGAIGDPMPKEAVHGWCQSVLGYDVARETELCRQGKASEAIAAAAWATQQVMVEYNRQLHVFDSVPFTRTTPPD